MTAIPIGAPVAGVYEGIPIFVNLTLKGKTSLMDTEPFGSFIVVSAKVFLFIDLVLTKGLFDIATDAIMQLHLQVL